ncbi:cysteine desulfurase family protein [Filifactor villosus]|uniref:Cysteine desulfurase family protein n=1 Tax=Filifactor villosus TaxID=29374 RepID=A0ABV9QJS5_9FIRM
MKIYLDNSATTKPYQEVVEEMKAALTEDFYNPSSIYDGGVDISRKIEGYRSLIADTLGCKPKELLFTSGGTESINTAIFSLKNSRKKHIITSMAEHSATLEAMKKMEKLSFEVTYLKPSKDGSIKPEQVLDALREDTCLISLMAVNNELGSVTDVIGIAKQVKKKQDVLIHVDAVQAYLKQPLKLYDKVIDFLSISAHKIHGPKGVGVLYHNEEALLLPLIVGGGQEGGQRSGTLNTPGIYGMGKAIELFYPDLQNHTEKIRRRKEQLRDKILEEIDFVKVLSPEDGICHILNLSFVGLRGEILLHSLEKEGIYVSTGSACSSKKSYSHVLNALELGREIKEGAIRFSLSEETTEEEIDKVVEALKKNVVTIRRIMKMGKRRNV